jgi:hypothetical protein
MQYNKRLQVVEPLNDHQHFRQILHFKVLPKRIFPILMEIYSYVVLQFITIPYLERRIILLYMVVKILTKPLNHQSGFTCNNHDELIRNLIALDQSGQMLLF